MNALRLFWITVLLEGKTLLLKQCKICGKIFKSCEGKSKKNLRQKELVIRLNMKEAVYRLLRVLVVNAVQANAPTTVANCNTPAAQKLQTTLKQFDVCFYQGPVMKRVELVNGGYGIKNPILTHGQGDDTQVYGKIQGLSDFIERKLKRTRLRQVEIHINISYLTHFQ